MEANSSSRPNTMRAVVWEGKPFEMVVRDVPKPPIQMPEDAIIRVTTAAICGSDLHIYRGVMGSSEVPYTVGHEAIGVVVEVGVATEQFKVGDRVLLPGIIDDGHLQTEPVLIPNFPIYGNGKDFGGLGGCQAEYVRVPFADDSLVKIPNNPSIDLQYLFLTDIFATGWECLNFSNFQAGDSVAVFGAGGVGLLCAYSALLRGASKVFVIDHVEERLEKARSIGCIPIDFTKKGGASGQILEQSPEGVMRSCDCVGFECLNAELKLQANYIMQEAAKITSVGGGIGFVGVYVHVPVSEGAPNADTIPADVLFPISTVWMKGLTMKGGGANIIGINPALLQLVESGRAKPSFIVTNEVGIEDAPLAYRRFNKQLETKVVIRFPWEFQKESRDLDSIEVPENLGDNPQ